MFTNKMAEEIREADWLATPLLVFHCVSVGEHSAGAQVPPGAPGNLLPDFSLRFPGVYATDCPHWIKHGDVPAVEWVTEWKRQGEI